MFEREAVRTAFFPIRLTASSAAVLAVNNLQKDTQVLMRAGNVLTEE